MTDDYDYDFYDSAFNDDLNELSEESSEEFAEESAEETDEETTEESVEESSEEQIETSTVEIQGNVLIDNFDLFDTPLNSCSAITLSLLFILFFLALATVGGVIRD